MVNLKIFQTYYHSPLGWLKIEGVGSSLVSMDFVSKKAHDNSPLKVRRELDQYFRGKRKKFSLRLAPAGTLFQQKVWKALQNISYGKRISYGEIAVKIGRRKSVRAVARAIGQNKLPIVIPCHRVVSADGSLTGYAYGLRKKAWLLHHEAGLKKVTARVTKPVSVRVTATSR